MPLTITNPFDQNSNTAGAEMIEGLVTDLKKDYSNHAQKIQQTNSTLIANYTSMFDTIEQRQMDQLHEEANQVNLKYRLVERQDAVRDMKEKQYAQLQKNLDHESALLEERKRHQAALKERLLKSRPWYERLSHAITGSTKTGREMFGKPQHQVGGNEAAKQKTLQRWKRQEEKDREWKSETKRWRSNLAGNIGKAIFDNPIMNFIKNHWGKLALLLGVLFLKPEQMRAVWDAMKNAMIWLWKEGPGILKTGFKIIGDAVQLIAWGIGKLVDFFFGKKADADDIDKQRQERDKYEEGSDEWKEEDKKLQSMKRGERQGGAFGDGGLGNVFSGDYLKKISVYLAGFAYLLSKLGPKGTLYRLAGGAVKGMFKYFRNKILEHKAQGMLTDQMRNMGQMGRGQRPGRFSRQIQFAKDTGAYLRDKTRGATQAIAKGGRAVGSAVGSAGRAVGGAAKAAGKVGGDWFKILMKKFGSAGKFLMKFGKSVIQGLMTMGPYGWAILGGIALGGLVWYFWDDITKVWDKVAGAIKDGFNKILEFASGIVGSAKKMIGSFLRGVGAGMIADWIDPEGADPEKKKEFTWGGFVEELWNIYSGLWKKIFAGVRALAGKVGRAGIWVLKSLGAPDWLINALGGKEEDPEGTDADKKAKQDALDAGPTDAQVAKVDAIQTNRKRKGKYATKAEFFQSEEYKSQIRKPDGTLRGISKGKKDDLWEAHLDGVDATAPTPPTAVKTDPNAPRDGVGHILKKRKVRSTGNAFKDKAADDYMAGVRMKIAGVGADDFKDLSKEDQAELIEFGRSRGVPEFSVRNNYFAYRPSMDKLGGAYQQASIRHDNSRIDAYQATLPPETKISNQRNLDAESSTLNRQSGGNTIVTDNSVKTINGGGGGSQTPVVVTPPSATSSKTNAYPK